MTMRKLGLIVVVGLLIGSVCLQNIGIAGGDSTTSFVSIEKFRSSGEDWKVASLNITPKAGSIRLQHDNWLMYFLHWRPLDNTNMNLSIEYVQNHLLNFWGPSMPFELTGDTGTTMIGDHTAYYAGGTIYDGMIKTRFIVWNCEETNRQFTADCNVNLKMGTLEKKLETQYDITSSICCHDGCSSSQDSVLLKTYSSADWNLSFNKPFSWRTLPFDTKQWFPDGMSSTNGTLWTLMTDSHKLVELYWIGHDESISDDLLEKSLKELVIDSLTARESPGITSFNIDTIYSAGGRFWAEGTYTWLADYNGQLLSDECSFVAVLWTKADNDFLMLAGLTHMNEIWGRTIDLTPSRKTIYRFLTDEVIPGIGIY